MDNLILKEYADRKEKMMQLIQEFFDAQNDLELSDEQCAKVLEKWTAEGHELVGIFLDEELIGFVHLTSHNDMFNHISKLYIDVKHQNQGYETAVLEKAEALISEQCESVYLDVDATDLSGAALYFENGYDCLESVTLRKDFHKEGKKTIRNERVLGCDVEVRVNKEEQELEREQGEDLFKKVLAGKNFTKAKTTSKVTSKAEFIYRGEQEREFYILFTRSTDEYDEGMMDEDVEIDEPYGTIIVAKNYRNDWIAKRNYYMGWKVKNVSADKQKVKGFDDPHYILIKDGRLTNVAEGSNYMIFEDPSGAIIAETLCGKFTLAKNRKEYDKLSDKKIEKKIYDAQMSGAR